MGVIYKATNNINNKSYIGQTKRSLEIRKKEHELEATNNRSNSIFHVALLKYGLDNFSWEILEECDNTILDEREKFWIDHFNTYIEGYNMTTGGQEGLNSWINNNLDQWKQNLAKRHGVLYYNNPNRFEEIRQQGTNASKVKVKCVELNIIFDSISDAARWSKTPNNPNGVEIKIQSISRVCRGHRKTTGGYHWTYV